MNFNIKCIGKLPGPTNEFEQSLVFETGEFERPKFDCISFFSKIELTQIGWFLMKLAIQDLHSLSIQLNHIDTEITPLRTEWKSEVHMV